MKTDGMALRAFCLLLFSFLSLYPAAASASGEREELREITGLIREEEAQLKKLRGEKNTAAKRVALIESKIENYGRMLRAINRDIASASARLKEIKAGISSAEVNIAGIKKDVARSNIFVIDNLGYSYIKIISTAKNPENTVKTLEILSKAGSALDGRIADLNAGIKELDALTLEQKSKMAGLASMKEEKARAAKALDKERGEYSRTLALLKNDEAGRLEYIEMLDFRRRELDDKIKEEARRGVEALSGDGASFSRLKGSMAWPVSGRVVEPYGERLVKEAGVKFFHKGWKIRPPDTADVLSPASGSVVFADYMQGFDNLVVISHGASYYTVYGNLGSVNVAAGQKVEKGGLLGRIEVDRQNNTSYLYFEIRKNEQALDPASWLASGVRR